MEKLDVDEVIEIGERIARENSPEENDCELYAMCKLYDSHSALLTLCKQLREENNVLANKLEAVQDFVDSRVEKGRP